MEHNVMDLETALKVWEDSNQARHMAESQLGILQAEHKSVEGLLKHSRTNFFSPQQGTSTSRSSSSSSQTLSQLQSVYAATSRLDAVVSDAKALCDMLSRLNSGAEVSVRRVREADGAAKGLQVVSDRVEDLLDLRTVLSGIGEATMQNDLEAIALHLRRFRAIERVLEVPESDVMVIRNTEESLLQRVLYDFDNALLQQEASSHGPIPPPTTTTNEAALVASTITRCCQLMALLGKAELGASRYISYVSSSLRSACNGDLRAAASMGVDLPLAALNVTSSIFGRTITTLESSTELATATFASSSTAAAGAIPTASLIDSSTTSNNNYYNDSAATTSSSGNGLAGIIFSCHAVADTTAARVVLSFARSARMQTAITARESLLSSSENPSAIRAQMTQDSAAQHQQRNNNDNNDGVGEGEGGGISAALAAQFATLLEDEKNEAPFVVSAAASGGGDGGNRSVFRGVDYSLPSKYDTFLDEVALTLQRCASYWRVILGRAFQIDSQLSSSAIVANNKGIYGGGSGTSSASSNYNTTVNDQQIAALAFNTVEAHLRSFPSHRLLDAVAELGGKYAALEQAFVQSGSGKALSLEEMLEDGAVGTSVDLLDVRLAVSTTNTNATTTSASSANEFSSAEIASLGNAVSSHLFGCGAICSTLVEDAFFVFQKACRRAFAAGHADAAAAVVNTVVFALQERIGGELEARFRLAIASSGGTNVASSSSNNNNSSSSGGSGIGLLITSNTISNSNDSSNNSSSSSSSSEVSRVAASMTALQVDRYNAIRNALMSSLVVRGAQSRIAEYAGVACGRGGTTITSSSAAAAAAGGGAGSSNSGDAGFSSPGGGRGTSSSSSSSSLDGSHNNHHAPGSAGGGRHAAHRLSEEVATAALILNNLQLAAESAMRLSSFLHTEAVAVFQDAKELSKVRTSLGGLADCAVVFRRSLESGISTLVTRLTPRLRSALNVFEGASSLIQYEMSPAAFEASSREGLNAFTTEFLPVLGGILAPYQYALTPSLAVSVVNKVAIFIAKQLEPRFRRKKFNQLGALQLDADMRALNSFFAARASRKIRDKFTRVLQLAQLLNLESPSDVLEYYTTSSSGSENSGNNKGAVSAGTTTSTPTPSSSVSGRSSGTASGSIVGLGGAPWELSSEDVMSTLSLRSDWSPAEIARLRL